MEFLLRLKKEFEEGDEESVKVAELKRVEQGGRTMQEFKRAIRRSRYQGEISGRGISKGV